MAEQSPVLWECVQLLDYIGMYMGLLDEVVCFLHSGGSSRATSLKQCRLDSANVIHECRGGDSSCGTLVAFEDCCNCCAASAAAVSGMLLDSCRCPIETSRAMQSLGSATDAAKDIVYLTIADNEEILLGHSPSTCHGRGMWMSMPTDRRRTPRVIWCTDHPKSLIMTLGCCCCSGSDRWLALSEAVQRCNCVVCRGTSSASASGQHDGTWCRKRLLLWPSLRLPLRATDDSESVMQAAHAAITKDIHLIANDPKFEIIDLSCQECLRNRNALLERKPSVPSYYMRKIIFRGIVELELASVARPLMKLSMYLVHKGISFPQPNDVYVVIVTEEDTVVPQPNDVCLVIVTVVDEPIVRLDEFSEYLMLAVTLARRNHTRKRRKKKMRICKEFSCDSTRRVEPHYQNWVPAGCYAIITCKDTQPTGIEDRVRLRPQAPSLVTAVRSIAHLQRLSLNHLTSVISCKDTEPTGIEDRVRLRPQASSLVTAVCSIARLQRLSLNRLTSVISCKDTKPTGIDRVRLRPQASWLVTGVCSIDCLQWLSLNRLTSGIFCGPHDPCHTCGTGSPSPLARTKYLRLDSHAYSSQPHLVHAQCTDAAGQYEVVPYSFGVATDESRVADVDLAPPAPTRKLPKSPTSDGQPTIKLSSVLSDETVPFSRSNRLLLTYTVTPHESVGTQQPSSSTQPATLLAMYLAGAVSNIAAFELVRLATLHAWPHLGKLSALNFSSAGFSYTGRADEVVCFSCGLTVSQWSGAAHPLAVHREKCGRQCPLIAEPPTSGNVPLSKTTLPPPLFVPDIQGAAKSSVNTEAPVNRGSSADTGIGSSISSSFGSGADSGLGYSLAQSLVSAAGGSSVKSFRLYSHGSHSYQTGGKSQQQLSEEDQNKSESYRLSTYADSWTYGSIVDPGDLARNGFYYTGSGDRVQCAFCQGVLRNWEAGDRVDEQHAQHFTYCRFVQGHEVGNIPIPFSPLEAKQGDRTGDSADCSRERDDLGITRAVPKNPEFAVESRRLSTFATWSPTRQPQPDVLAKAGFFYLGNEVTVKCFFCDGVVADWRSNSDPWVEHAQRFPTCSFVIQVKGQEFVQRHRTDEPPSSFNTQTTSFAVDPREIRARMDSPKVRILLQMDYPLELVREVVQKRLATVGRDHDTSEELLADIFATHDEKQRASTSQASAARRTAAIEPVVVSLPRDGKSASQISLPALPVARAACAVAAMAGLPQLPVPDRAQRSAEKTTTVPPEEENRQLKTQLTCKICMDSVVGIVFLPCGHLVCCPVCAPAVTSCPICRVTIRGTVRTSI